MKAQAYNVDFELHTLGWKAFQDLCATIFSEILENRFEYFHPSHDGGRDGAFYGIDPKGKKPLPSTVQCKFSSNLAGTLSIANLEEELGKAKILAERGLAVQYFLMTNLSLTGTREEEIRTHFLNSTKIEFFFLFGYERLTGLIKESPRLRALVPRVYGLGDLSQIIDQRAYEQAKVLLEAMRNDLSKFVITNAYKESVKAVQQKSFVLLLGQPAAGKSTIASCLALAAMDRWKSTILKLKDPEDFIRHWNPNETNQFFWFDDAFGATQFQRDVAFSWNKVFPALLAAIKKGTKILFTSRDYIFRQALKDLKLGVFPLISDSQVIIEVEKYTTSEKKQIVYNHMKLGDQECKFKTEIKPFLGAISESNTFLPEIARRLGTGIFTRNLTMSKDSITHFLIKPMDFLIETINNLDYPSQASLGLIFMAHGKLSCPIETHPNIEKNLQTFGIKISEARDKLLSLKDTLATLVQNGDGKHWSFKHPTIRDALAKIYADNPEMVRLFILGAPIETIMSEVRCHGIEFAGSSIELPESLFVEIIPRFSEASQYLTRTFLTNRCSRDFVIQFLEYFPNTIDELFPLNEDYCSTTQGKMLVYCGLNNLLSAKHRKLLVSEIIRIGEECFYVEFLEDEEFCAILSNEELAFIRTTLIERLPENYSKYEELCDSYDSRYDPEDHFYPLRKNLDLVIEKYDDKVLNSFAENLASKISEKIEEFEFQKKAERDSDNYDRFEDRNLVAERDMFDDVDS